MRKFDVIKAITDEKKFSELIFDLISVCKTSEKLTELLSEEMSEGALRTVKEISDSEYPLVLDYLVATEMSSTFVSKESCGRICRVRCVPYDRHIR